MADYEKLFGNCASRLVTFVDKIPTLERRKNLHYEFFMNNYFSNPALF